MADRIYPQSNRIYPVPATDRIYPVRPTEAFFAAPGSSRRALLNELVYPFADLVIDPSVTVATIEHKAPGAGSWTTVSAGSHADIIEAARFVQFTPTTFAVPHTWNLRITVGSDILTYTLDVFVDVRIGVKRQEIPANEICRPFGSASFALNQTGITAVQYEVSGAATVAKTDIPRMILVSNTHDGAGNAAALTDTGTNFTEAGVEVNDDVANTTDGSEAVVTGITTTTNTDDTLTGTLSGGTDNDWDASDAYEVYKDEDSTTGLIDRVKKFEYQPSASGTHTLTLYVNDGTSEYQDSCEVVVP